MPKTTIDANLPVLSRGFEKETCFVKLDKAEKMYMSFLEATTVSSSEPTMAQMEKLDIANSAMLVPSTSASRAVRV